MRMSSTTYPPAPQWDGRSTLTRKGSQVLVMLLPKACMWCNGDLYLDRDRMGLYLKCLQCGRECAAPENLVKTDRDLQAARSPAGGESSGRTDRS